MPEYLAPGVFVEEVSFRSKSIEGVPTSTTGFAGMTRYGPVQYPAAGANPRSPLSTEPRLITSFTEFERVYGGLEPIFAGPANPGSERLSYVAHAARVFFDNGGKRLYISRVFKPRVVAGGDDWGIASGTALNVIGVKNATWRARWPGDMGEVLVETRLVRSKNIAYLDNNVNLTQVRRAKAGAVVEVNPPAPADADPNPIPALNDLRVVRVANGRQTFVDSAGNEAPLGAGAVVQLLELRVLVTVGLDRLDTYDELGMHPDQTRFIGKILDKDDPEDEDAVIWLDWTPSADPAQDFEAARLLVALAALRGDNAQRLTGGHDGDVATPDDLAGKEADLDHADIKATGLAALGEIDDIAIVALPDGGTLGTADLCGQAADRLITHAEKLKYRIAIVDAPEHSSMTEVRHFRGRFDTKYAALYHPWIEILDPLQRPSQGAPPDRLMLPPSGFAAGIFARTDITRGVHKAPANEVVRGLTRFEANINTARQEVLNPEGINAMRFFEGRGYRVWGARTMSSDPEWKYVNVRRLFIYVEHSIDMCTQWAVFEPNNPTLWDNIRQSVEDFLLVLWRDGALLGDTPAQAYFVRCDRTTMTQNDLDNGRMICLIGIAPVRPAEFVIFRIGQWTADARSA